MRRGQHAELVALRVGEYNPGLLALSDVDPLRAEADEALDLRVTVMWAEVKVQSVLHYLPLRDSDEQQPRAPIGRRTDLELLGIVVHDHPAERVQPPAAEGSGIAGVDDDLFPLDAHPQSVVRSRDHQVSAYVPSVHLDDRATGNSTARVGLTLAYVGQMLGTLAR
jgi:hypothetical protein